jgi:hypothetical protein
MNDLDEARIFIILKQIAPEIVFTYDHFSPTWGKDKQSAKKKIHYVLVFLKFTFYRETW